MTKKLVALLIAVGLGCSANAAMADGYAASGGAPAAVAGGGCTGGPFQGWYVGGHVGYGEHDMDVDNLVSDPDPLYNLSSSEGGFTGGLLSGYNHQCGRLVVGFEGDINYFDADPSVTDVDGATYATEMSYFGTERLRIGIVHDNRILFYATGGLAYAEIDYKFGVDCCLNSSRSEKEWGWTVGGGVEILRDERWTLRAEALYVDLGDNSENYVVPPPCVGVTCTTDNKYENDFWVARVGLTYRFGRREEAAPLK